MIQEGIKIEAGTVVVITYTERVSMVKLAMDKKELICELCKAMQCEEWALPVGVMQVGPGATLKLLSEESKDPEVVK